MLALVDDGLTEAVPNKGFQTVPLTPADLAEIYEMRAGFDDMRRPSSLPIKKARPGRRGHDGPKCLSQDTSRPVGGEVSQLREVPCLQGQSRSSRTMPPAGKRPRPAASHRAGV